MISIKNYYDSSNLVNKNKVQLPYKGLYEDLFNFNGIIIETFSNVNDTLYIDFLNSYNFLSDISSTPIITETYTINASSPKTFIIQPRLRYYRLRITTLSFDPDTDNRKYLTRLINSTVLPNKIYGSENMPIVTDSSGNLSLPTIETLIGETNTILQNLSVAVDLSGAHLNVDMSGTDLILTNIYNDVSGLPSSLNLIQNDISGGFMLLHQDLQNLDISGGSFDMSGTNLILTQIHNDVSGLDSRLVTIHNDVSGFSNLQFDTSKNLLVSEMNNFTVNTSLNKTKSQFINIIADNGGIVLNGLDGTRDFVYGSQDASGAFYIFNSIKNNINLSSSSSLDNTSYSILITGLSDTYSIIYETLNMNGTSQVTSSNQYFRLNSLEVITAPSNGLTFVNPLNGDITITDSSSNIFGIIDSKSGKRCAGVYTVPIGYRLLITKIELSDENNQGSTVFLYTRDATSTNKRFNLLAKYYFLNEKRDINRESNPLVLNEKTDLILRIKTDGTAYCNISAILSI